MKYIFEIHVRDGYSVDDYVNAWKEGSRIIQSQHGAKGTRLFKNIHNPRVLLAIADWESKAARDYAMTILQNSDAETQLILHRHEAIANFRHIGEFDDTEWKVIF